MTNKHKLKLESLMRVSVKRIVEKNSVSRQLFDDLIITFQYAESNVIKIFWNKQQLPICYQVSERQILGRLRNGGYIPWDKSSDYYVVARDGKRCKYLYINRTTLEIGCRSDYNPIYKSSRDCRKAKRIKVIRAMAE